MAKTWRRAIQKYGSLGAISFEKAFSKQSFADKNRYIYQLTRWQSAVINSSGRWLGAVLQFYSSYQGQLIYLPS
jgi:hypothetical protein